MIQEIRTKVMWAMIVVAAVSVALALAVDRWWWVAATAALPVAFLGVDDDLDSVSHAPDRAVSATRVDNTARRRTADGPETGSDLRFRAVVAGR